MQKTKDILAIEEQWLHIKNTSKHKRSSLCIQWLEKNEIVFESFNQNMHIQLHLRDNLINIWPTTERMHIIDEKSNIKDFHGTHEIITQLEKFINLIL